MISIIIPTLNEEKFLPKLLDSLITQTNKDFEVIVVDGTSTDTTISKAKSYIKKLPSLQIFTTSASLPGQRNFGATKAKGDWLVFVDADSVLMPYFLERIIWFIHNKKPEFFTTWAQPDSDSVDDAIITLFANIYFESSIKFKRQIAPGPLTIIKRKAFEFIGGYDETHAFHEDWELGLRLAKHGINLSILRESLFIWSMRRIRTEGKLKVMQQYIVSIFPILLFKHPLKFMPGYIMGGQLYDKKKKKIRPSVIKQFQMKLKGLMKEFLE